MDTTQLNNSFEEMNQFITEEFGISREDILNEFVFIPLLIWGSMALYRFLKTDFKDPKVNRYASDILNKIKEKEDIIKRIEEDRDKMPPNALNDKYKDRVKRLNQEIDEELNAFSEEFKRAQKEGKTRDDSRKKVLQFSKVVKEMLKDEERVMRKKGVMAYEDERLSDRIKNMSRKIKGIF